jgi:hypothetical protein
MLLWVYFCFVGTNVVAFAVRAVIICSSVDVVVVVISAIVVVVVVRLFAFFVCVYFFMWTVLWSPTLCLRLVLA